MDARSSYSTTHLHENKTKGNEIELKGVQFPAAVMPLMKLLGAANR